jgi:hypothetical protein
MRHASYVMREEQAGGEALTAQVRM